MMRTKLKVILCLTATVIFLFCLSGTVFADDAAQELNDNILELLNGLDLSELENYLHIDENNFLYTFGSNAREIIEYFIHGNLSTDYAGYLNELLSVLFNQVISFVPAFAQVIALSILCAIVRSVEGSIMSRSTSKTICIACYAVIITIVVSMLVGVMLSAKESIDCIKSQVEIITPILVTLTVLTGGSSSGAIYQPSALFISGGAIQIVSGIIFPVTVVIIVTNFISILSPGLSFSGTSKLLKSILKLVIGITLAVFSIFITVQSTASSLFDGIFFKATQYLVGNSVPIVGNFLSSGVDMVVAAGSLIRSSVGMLGIVLLIIEIAPPIILLIAFSLMLKLVAAIVQPVGENTLCALFTDLSSDTEYFIAGMCTVGFMYALIVMLIISSATNFL